MASTLTPFAMIPAHHDQPVDPNMAQTHKSRMIESHRILPLWSCADKRWHRLWWPSLKRRPRSIFLLETKKPPSGRLMIMCPAKRVAVEKEEQRRERAPTYKIKSEQAIQSLLQMVELMSPASNPAPGVRPGIKLVEVGGVEPPSESTLTGLSPGADGYSGSPPPCSHPRRQAVTPPVQVRVMMRGRVNSFPPHGRHINDAFPGLWPLRFRRLP